LRVHAETRPPELGALRHACRFCLLQDLCCPMDLGPCELEQLQAVVRHSAPLPAGRFLFRAGDRFTAIYALRSGCIKSFSLDAGGHETVHSFHLRGELLGLDAVYPDTHRCNALVLEASSVCVIPYRDVVKLCVDFPSLHGQVLRLMSREFSKQIMYGEGYSAIQRTAAFLLNVHSRLNRPGVAIFDFRLPMSREDISNYLGISSETLSRLLARLQRKRMIAVDRRHIRLLDSARLELIAIGVD
jgi:CRP/FNR family transcriptional regulator, anaerobic regulatory protein